MAIGASGLTNSYKKELLEGNKHSHTNATGSLFKVALYTNSATIDITTTAYTATGEVPASGTYVAGGYAFTRAQNVTPAYSGSTAYTGWNTNPSWTGATITAYGCMFYNSEASNASVIVINFGGPYSTTAGTFTITLPATDATTGLIRLTD